MKPFIELTPSMWRRLIESIIPYPTQAPEYIVLAALLSDPEMAFPFMQELRPGHWQSPLLQRVAQAALHDIGAYGHVNATHHFERLKDLGIGSAAAIDLTAATLEWVSLLTSPSTFANAVHELTSRVWRVAS